MVLQKWNERWKHRSCLLYTSPERLEAKKQELETVEQQFVTAKAEVEKPFDKEEELTEKTNRLGVLNGLLNVDKRENELVDGTPDECDDIPVSKERDMCIRYSFFSKSRGYFQIQDSIELIILAFKFFCLFFGFI